MIAIGLSTSADQNRIVTPVSSPGILPKTSWLVVNYACNLSCVGCYAAGAITKQTQMEVDFAKDALAELARIGVNTCILIGGEPTIHPRIGDIIRFGANLGIKMQMVSNGMALKSKALIDRICDAGISGVAVSIEGATAEEHDGIRGRGSFSDAMRGLENCLERGILSNSISTVSHRNGDQIVPVARRLSRVGVKRILFNFFIPPLESKGVGVDSDPRAMAQSAIDAYRILMSDGIAVRFFGTLPLCWFGEHARDMSAAGYMPNKTTCHMFSSTGIVLEPTGSLIPCTHAPGIQLFATTKDGGKTFGLGGMLDEAWTECRGVVERFREALWTYPSTVCKTCSMWGNCLGGCPLLWNAYDPARCLKAFS